MSVQESRENFRRSRKEAFVALAGWFFAFAWTIIVSYWLGRETPAPLLFGVPRWIVLGVALPWGFSFLFTCWYSIVFLGERKG